VSSWCAVLVAMVAEQGSYTHEYECAIENKMHQKASAPLFLNKLELKPII
jgi:hypothetical protein